ncbi:MAG: YbaB/EbfC family nucleoid-associated protein [Clostridiales bacterium]|jgi:DNA-binding YbaB/EbfC family protein|nr:YbaB/EbfC family nucleoid-associated protein [Clostridiales bacterium]
MGRGMKAGKLPKQKQPDMQKQLRQAMQMQNEMEKAQAEIEKKELTTTAGGGAVEVTVNGKKELTKLVIDEEVVSPDEVDMLQDLIMAAVNEAIRQMDKLAEDEMAKITGGLGDLGGMGGLGF